MKFLIKKNIEPKKEYKIYHIIDPDDKYDYGYNVIVNGEEEFEQFLENAKIHINERYYRGCRKALKDKNNSKVGLQPMANPVHPGDTPISWTAFNNFGNKYSEKDCEYITTIIINQFNNKYWESQGWYDKKK